MWPQWTLTLFSFTPLCSLCGPPACHQHVISVSSACHLPKSDLHPSGPSTVLPSLCSHGFSSLPLLTTHSSASADQEILSWFICHWSKWRTSSWWAVYAVPGAWSDGVDLRWGCSDGVVEEKKSERIDEQQRAGRLKWKGPYLLREVRYSGFDIIFLWLFVTTNQWT